MCKAYLAVNPGQVVTNDDLASLLAHAWPQSLTPVNANSGFEKCGIYPLGTFRSSASTVTSFNFVLSASDADLVKLCFTQEEEEMLYQTRLEEGYDLHNPKYR